MINDDILKAVRETREETRAAAGGQELVTPKTAEQLAAAPVTPVTPSVTPAGATPVAEPAVAGEVAKAAAILADPNKTFKASRVVTTAADPSIIIGIGAVAGNIDLDNETLSQKAMVDMAHQFCSASERTFKMNHDKVVKASLVESWIGAPIYKLQDGSLKVVKAVETVPDGAAFAGISNEEQSHWFIAVRPEDQSLVQKAKEGTFGGFSWAGFVDKQVAPSA